MSSKTCTKCSCTKSSEDFYARSRAPDGREAWCKVCRLAHNRKWVAANPERQSALTSKWYADNKDKHKHIAASKARYNANPSAALAKYYKRAERTKRATPIWANLKLIEKMYTAARNINALGGEKWEVDHVYPLQGKTVCGLPVLENLALMPASANRSKGNKIVEQYIF